MSSAPPGPIPINPAAATGQPTARAELPLAEPAIEIRLFAGLRERAGWGERRLPLPAAAPLTPAALWLQLDLGGGAALPATVRVAINQAFASPHQPLVAGDELAFLPPISGG
jgi:molybdopterin synthase sulfur carrier subunit